MAYTNPLSTLATDPVRNFKFIVEFLPQNPDTNGFGASFGKLGFVSLSGLSVSTEAIAYREGGYNTNVHQIPGQSSFTPISLSKGVMLGNDVHAKWMRRLFSVLTPNATKGIADTAQLKGANFRVDLDIAVLSHPNPAGLKGVGGADATTAAEQHASMRFRVHNAWITSLAYSNLDAGSSTLMVEEMTLVHEGFDVTFGTDYSEAGSAKKFQANGTFA